MPAAWAAVRPALGSEPRPIWTKKTDGEKPGAQGSKQEPLGGNARLAARLFRERNRHIRVCHDEVAVEHHAPEKAATGKEKGGRHTNGNGNERSRANGCGDIAEVLDEAKEEIGLHQHESRPIPGGTAAPAAR